MKISIKSLVALALTAFIATGSVEAAESVTVSDLHANRIALGGKQITIIGTVIKVNNNIMRRNFIHVQDGTGSGNTDRVIFTSQQEVSVGDKVAGTGTVALDTDFSMGYFYPTLIEQATFEPAK